MQPLGYSGTSLFIHLHVWSLATLSIHNQASGDGPSDAIAKQGNQSKDEGGPEERGIRASWNMQGHFPICPSPGLMVETPGRNIWCVAPAFMQVSLFVICNPQWCRKCGSGKHSFQVWTSCYSIIQHWFFPLLASSVSCLERFKMPTMIMDFSHSAFQFCQFLLNVF